MNVFSQLLNHVLRFVIQLFKRVPTLYFSKKICRASDGSLWVKLVNRSRVIGKHLEFELCVVTARKGVEQATRLVMPNPLILEIAPYDPNDTTASYAIRFVLPKDLERHWINDNVSFLRLKVNVFNNDQTKSKLYEKIYRYKSAIVTGRFETGLSTRIVK